MLTLLRRHDLAQLRVHYIAADGKRVTRIFDNNDEGELIEAGPTLHRLPSALYLFHFWNVYARLLEGQLQA